MRGKNKKLQIFRKILDCPEYGKNFLSAKTFDQLGLLRTEEFLLAASYYGLDDLYLPGAFRIIANLVSYSR